MRIIIGSLPMKLSRDCLMWGPCTMITAKILCLISKHEQLDHGSDVTPQILTKNHGHNPEFRQASATRSSTSHTLKTASYSSCNTQLVLPPRRTIGLLFYSAMFIVLKPCDGAQHCCKDSIMFRK